MIYGAFRVWWFLLVSCALVGNIGDGSFGGRWYFVGWGNCCLDAGMDILLSG